MFPGTRNVERSTAQPPAPTGLPALPGETENKQVNEEDVYLRGRRVRGESSDGGGGT